MDVCLKNYVGHFANPSNLLLLKGAPQKCSVVLPLKVRYTGFVGSCFVDAPCTGAVRESG